MESDELDAYRAQLRSIDSQLTTCTDLQTRSALLESRSDLIELITLMAGEDDDASDSLSRNIDSTIATTSGTQVDSSELIGMHCLAPYKSNVDKAISYHDGVILDITQSVGDEIMVRILYGHPLEAAMKPCEFFLDNRCTYEGNCRFSHGEIVPFSELIEYERLDDTSLSVESLVLVQGDNDNGLWRSARVVDLDQKKIAVQSLKTSKEFAVDRAKVYGVPESAKTFSESESVEDSASTSWQEYKQETKGRVTVGDLGDWEKHTRGIGSKLLLKMGYRIGEGLGKKSDGIVHAIQPVIFSKKTSLDECTNPKNRRVVDGIKRRQDYVKREMVKKLKNIKSSDVFDVLNSKLNGPAEAKSTSNLENVRQLQNYSSRGLGVQSMGLEKEIREMKAKERKLRDGIARNQRDQATAAKLRKSLTNCSENIRLLNSRQQKINAEMDSRLKKKDIF